MEFESESSGPQAKALTAMPFHFLSCLQVVFTISFNCSVVKRCKININFCVKGQEEGGGLTYHPEKKN